MFPQTLPDNGFGRRGLPSVTLTNGLVLLFLLLLVLLLLVLLLLLHHLTPLHSRLFLHHHHRLILPHHPCVFFPHHFQQLLLVRLLLASPQNILFLVFPWLDLLCHPHTRQVTTPPHIMSNKALTHPFHHHH